MSRPYLSTIVPGLIVLHSNRMEILRDSLLQWLAHHPLDPLEVDVIAVQSNGIAQWLRSTFAKTPSETGGGIAAALETPMPSRMVWSLYRQVLGVDAVPEASPLDETPLVWRLMRLLGDLPDLVAFGPLGRYLEDDADLRKRYQLALRLADLYDQYQVYRADWLADWAAGADVLISAGRRVDMPEAQRWQSALWREILADVGAQGGETGRASVHAQFLQRLQQWPQDQGRPALPRRITVFGVSALPRQALEALVEIARWTQVLVCVHNPCAYHWSDIVEGRALLRRVKHHQLDKPGMPAAIGEDELHDHAHPLLASWGRQGRDYIALLEELEEESTQRQLEGGHPAQQLRFVPVFEEHRGVCLLEQLQDDIRALRPLPEIREENRVVSGQDHSVCFHVAHSPLREVEILHDQLLAAFDADHTLEPDDIIVMVPDIEHYAPHIEAVFGLHTFDDPRRLPYFIVDRGPAQTNTVVKAVEQLLALPVSRVTVGQVLDLLDIAALRCRFGLGEDDLAILRQWVEGANVRWGLSSGHREALGLPIEGTLADLHTWSFGLRRMLLGYATGEGGEWNGIAPYGDVAGLDAALVGILAEVVDRLVHYAESLSLPATPQEWAVRLRALLEDFLVAPDDIAGYTIEQLTLALEAWLEQCELTGFDQPLPLQVVGAHWLASLEQAGMSQRFSSGAITFATLMPMRAIPFRHVCLLGMNNDAYPRPRVTVQFDLMEKDYRPGDRSRRDDDRYLFLEALLSARERFHVSWVGRSIVDNTERPPSVLVGQLRDHIAAGWRAASPANDVLEQITIEHPLQAFSPRYFSSASGEAELFTYSREWRSSGARAGIHGYGGPLPEAHASERLDAVSRDEPLSIDELMRFLEHPVREFFKQRLQVRVEESEAPAEDESFVANGLEVWQVHDALIRVARQPLLTGEDPLPACKAELERMARAGELAYGAAGRVQIESCQDEAMPMFDTFREMLGLWPLADPDIHELEHHCAGTPGLIGWLRGLRRDEAGALSRLEMQGSSLIKNGQWRDEKLLGHWLWHLLANSSGLNMSTTVISPAGNAHFIPIEPEYARSCLDTLLTAWAEGMRRPLPIKPAFAHPVLTVLLAGQSVEAEPDWPALLQSDALASSLRKCHEENWGRTGRGDTLYEVRAYPDFEGLMSEGELLMWAVKLYGPMFQAVRKEKGR